MTLADDGLYVTGRADPARPAGPPAKTPIWAAQRELSNSTSVPTASSSRRRSSTCSAPWTRGFQGSGAWQPVEMPAEAIRLTIDLSNLTLPGSPPASAPTVDGLTDAELGDLLDAMDEAGCSTATTTRRPRCTTPATARGRAVRRGVHARARRPRPGPRGRRAAALVEDLCTRPRATRTACQRIIGRAAGGVYDGQQVDFSAEPAAVEISWRTAATGRAARRRVRPVLGRYHDLECATARG